MNCPIDKTKDDCASCDYAKEGLCDYPYKNNMSPEEWTRIDEILMNMEAQNGF